MAKVADLRPSLFGVRRVEDFDGVFVLLGPPQIHPHQHLGEVRSVDTPGAGANRHERIANVVLARQQGPDLERLHGFLHPDELGFGVCERLGVAFFLGHLDEQAEVVDPGVEFGEAVQLPVENRQPTRDALGVGLVVPKIGRSDLLAELGDFGAHLVQIQDLLDRVHGRLELLDLSVKVGSGHEKQPYATRELPTRSALTLRAESKTVGTSGSAGCHRVTPRLPLTA